MGPVRAAPVRTTVGPALPESFFLLRGNHECETVNNTRGFLHECQSRSRRLVRASLWEDFNAVFACLPLAALVVSGDGQRRILCVHGGLSPELQSLGQIREVERPLAVVPKSGLVCDLLWSDPAHDDGQEGWGKPRREVSCTFGADVVAGFCKRHGLDMVCRAHEMKMGGYDDRFAGGKLVPVFSAPNYCGTCGNDGAVIAVGLLPRLPPCSRSPAATTRSPRPITLPPAVPDAP